MIKIRIPLLALAFLAMTVVGWNLGGNSGAIADQAAPPADRPSRPAHPARSSGPDAAAGKSLAAIRGAGTPEARTRATIDLANSLPPSEFAAWLDGGWFKLRGGPDLIIFTKILLARWEQEDLEGLLAWSLKNESGEGWTILAAWSEKEPQRLIDFFKKHPDDPAEMQALAEIANHNPGLALQRLLEMAATGISRQGMEYSSGVLRHLAEKSPAALGAALDSLPAQLRIEAETALSGERLKTSFATEIRALWELPNGWKIFESNAQQDREVGAKIFDELANLPPAWRASLASNSYYFMGKANHEKWLDADLAGYGFSLSQTKEIRRYALNNLASSQPVLALKRMGEMDLDSSNRQNVISNAISSADNDPVKVAALIALLGTEEDRKVAQAIVDANNGSQSQTKIEKPADWLEKIGALDPKSGSSYPYFSMLEQWDQAKISDLNAQFIALPDDKKPQVAQAIAAGGGSSGASPLKGEAIRYLLTNPVAIPEGGQNNRPDPIQMASQYAVFLAVKDAAAATGWVHTLPAGDAKLWAQKNLARNWAQYDPKAVDQWVNTLPADARTEVQAFLKK